MKKLSLAAITLCVAAIALQSQQKAASSGKIMGRPEAPVRIDLYSDFQCPACRVLHQQTLKPLIEAYVNTGKVYLVQHEYPLPMHAHAREAACYACAAEKLGRYQEVADQLFLNQQQWEKDGNVFGAASSVLTKSDAQKMKQLASAPEILKEVDEEVRAAQAEKVNQTPTMIITRTLRRYPVSGPVSFAVLSKFLDSILN